MSAAKLDTGQDVRAVRELPAHAEVKITMVNTRVLNRLRRTARPTSRADAVAAHNFDLSNPWNFRAAGFPIPGNLRGDGGRGPSPHRARFRRTFAVKPRLARRGSLRWPLNFCDDKTPSRHGMKVT